MKLCLYWYFISGIYLPPSHHSPDLGSKLAEGSPGDKAPRQGRRVRNVESWPRSDHAVWVGRGGRGVGTSLGKELREDDRVGLFEDGHRSVEREIPPGRFPVDADRVPSPVDGVEEGTPGHGERG